MTHAILRVLEALPRDVRYAARTLRRDAVMTTFALLIIGIGVGASTNVFSVVNALWLRPLPFDDPGRLVGIANGTAEGLSRQSVQVGHVVDLREQSQSLIGVAGFAPSYGVGDIRLTGTGELDRSVFIRRIIVQLLAGFAGFGLILASLGLYAVISYAVSQRTREIGVRIALGAAPLAMQGRILLQTMTLAAIGLAIGLPVASLAARAIQGLLFGVVASDPATFGGVVAVVAIVAGLAGYVPARRASRVDPVVALRSD